MTTQISLFFSLLLIISNSAFSAIYVAESTQKQIQKSNLIVRGTVDSISVDTKNRITFVEIFDNENGTSEVVKVDGSNSIITTFSLNIKEVLYGSFDNKGLIQVEMNGGCHDGICLEESSNYNLIKGEEYVLFLFKDEINNVFKSTSASYSVFKVVNENDLLRLTDSIISNPYDGLLNKDSDHMPDLDYLRQEVEKYLEKEKSSNED